MYFYIFFLGNSTLSCGPFSPSNVSSGITEIDDKFKAKVKSSPGGDRVLTIKAEPPWEMDSVDSREKRSDSEYSIDMNARTVLELCK